jgi:beta-glucosidase
MTYVQKQHSKMLIISSMIAVLSACNYISDTTENGVDEKKIVDKSVAKFWPELTIKPGVNPAMEARIQTFLVKMTLEQKVAQMIQPEIRDITVEDMRKYGFGSYLNGGGAFPNDNKHATPADWVELAENMYQASIDDSLDGSKIPTMWGTDAVHGHNNVIGATLFPHNIGLGAANNPKLIENIAAITAKEVMVTGIDWVFAPTVAVVRDDRWGRTYEGYSEDPEIVANYATAIVEGLQGIDDKFLSEHHVIGTVKHFLGDGGTVDGDDQGDNIDTEEQLFKLHAQGYVSGLAAGAQTVMASFNSWHGVKNHGNKYLLTDVLKTRMGFDGLVVGDWNGHGQIAGCTNESCSQTINAGLDIYMVPTDAWKPLYENTIAQVKNGEIPMSRIDDAVSRILRVKMRADLFNKKSPANRPLSGKTELIGAAEHRAVARDAVRQSLVLLKNKNNLLPLMPNTNVLVAGDGADNIGKQSGGWSVTWQGTGNVNTDFPGGSSIYAGIEKIVNDAGGRVQLNVDGEYSQKPDVAIVVFGEEPYAEGNGDLANLEYQRGNKKDLALLKKLKAQGIPVVSVFISGRPMWVNAELNASDAFVAAWLPGSEGEGVSDVIFKNKTGDINYNFVGKLSFSWPSTPLQTTVNRFDKDYQPLLPYGFGLTYQPTELTNNIVVLSDTLNEVFDTQPTELQPLAILQGSVKAPWQLYISTELGFDIMTSSTIQNEIIHIRTTDKVVQEDARKISFNGLGEGKVALTSPFSSDLLAYAEAKSVLSLNVKVDSDVVETVNLGMACGEQCASMVDIAPTLKTLTKNTWATINIDLTCFSDAGANMGKIFTPFSLSTSGQLDITIADIMIVPESVDKASIVCSQ